MFVKTKINDLKSMLGYTLTREKSLLTNHDLNILYSYTMHLFSTINSGEISIEDALVLFDSNLLNLKDCGSYDSFTFTSIGHFASLFNFCLTGDVEHFDNKTLSILVNNVGFQISSTYIGLTFRLDKDVILRNFKNLYGDSVCDLE